MATNTWLTTCQIDTDAHFRSLFSPISASLAAAGWVNDYQTFLTGSSWTDVTRPLTNDVAAVTEVWRMNDSFQATAPLFMKLEYGRSNAATTPAIRITWGTGHSGGGTITTQLCQTRVDDNTFLISVSVTTATTHFAAGGNSWFVMALNGLGGTNSNQFGFSIERRKDNTGADLGNGFLFAFWDSYGVQRKSKASTATTAGTLLTAICCASVPSSDILDGQRAISPILYALGPAEIGRNLCGSIYNTAGTTFTSSAFGTTTTYLVLTYGAPPIDESQAQARNTLSIRYE